MWIVLHDDDRVTIDSDAYIKSQPVSYEQVAGTIEEIRRRGVPVRACIDVTSLRLARVNVFGVVRIVWELHEETYGENLLCALELVGASPRVALIWELLKRSLPEFIRRL